MQVLNVTCKEDKSVCSSLVSLFLAVRRVLGTEQAVSRYQLIQRIHTPLLYLLVETKP